MSLARWLIPIVLVSALASCDVSDPLGPAPPDVHTTSLEPADQTYCTAVNCDRLTIPMQRYYDVERAVEDLNDSSDICTEMRGIGDDLLFQRAFYYYDWDDGYYGWAYYNPESIDLSPANWHEGEVTRTVAHELYHIWHMRTYGTASGEFLADVYMDACTVQ